MDEEREQASCDNRWGERISYYNGEEREQAIIIDEKREQAFRLTTIDPESYRHWRT